MLVWIVVAPVCEVNAEEGCSVSVAVRQVTDNGDGDGIADTNETLQIGIKLHPHCPSSAERPNDCVAWLSTESPAIECIRKGEILIGGFPSRLAVVPEETFEVKIGAIDRHDLGLEPDDPLEALLTLEVRCSYGVVERSVRESFALPLDLNVDAAGQQPTLWKEDFEAGGTDPADPLQGTKFYAQNLDAGLPGNSNLEGLLLSFGYRCQYSDPNWRNAASYNHAQGEVCYPGMNLAQANAVFWQVDGSLIAGTPDGGRAYRGEKSLYYGIFLGHADESFTTPLSTIESVATTEPINLGVGNPQLSFWQQISLADYRSISSRPLRNIDRGVVQIQLHDSADHPVTAWTNLQPIQNPYDQQAEDNYFNCTFDPIDDGNDEDDFFDPTDPDRDLGPSSTCFPSFSWAFMGATTSRYGAYPLFGNAWIEDWIGFPPPEWTWPDHGTGIWIESIVDLSEFRGRRAKLRYLVTSLKGTAETHVGQFGPDRDERDDGWWIDEIEISETLSEPATYHNDGFLLGSCSGTGNACIGQCRASLTPCSNAIPCSEGEGDCVLPCPPGEVCAGPPPDCGANCSEAQVNLFVEPHGPLNPASISRGELGGPPMAVNFAAPFNAEIGAEPSWVDVCIDGNREYRACISGDPDGDGSGLPDADCDDPWDSLACESCPASWSPTSRLLASEDIVTTYAVEMRCSSAPDCGDSRTIEIVVECFGNLPNTNGLREMRALNKQMLTWRGVLDVDWLRGSFASGAQIGNYVADFTDFASYATSIPMDEDPPAGNGFYYLVKADGRASSSDLYYCSTTTWRSGGQAELIEPARNNAFRDP